MILAIIHSFFHSLVHSFIDPCIDLFVYSFIRRAAIRSFSNPCRIPFVLSFLMAVLCSCVVSVRQSFLRYSSVLVAAPVAAVCASWA